MVRVTSIATCAARGLSGSGAVAAVAVCPSAPVQSAATPASSTAERASRPPVMTPADGTEIR